MFDNFKFDLVTDYPGYVSSKDKTLIKEGFLVRGSQNVFKKRSGAIANRFGLKRRGAVNATDAGVVSSFEWNDTQGRSLPLRVANNKLQFESFIANGTDPVWYDLLETSTLLNPARSLTRFVFDTWWDTNEGKDKLLMVRGDSNVLHWSGGIAKVASITQVNQSVNTNGILLSNAGTGYVVGDVLTLAGGNNDAQIVVGKIGASGVIVDGFYLKNLGSGYTSGTLPATGGTGSGAIFTFSVTTSWNITKQDSSKTWAQVGFNKYYLFPSTVHVPPFYYYKKFIVNGSEFNYIGGEATTTLNGITTDPTGIINANDIVIQSVFVESLILDIPDTDFTADMIKVMENQAFYASYTSRIVHISTDQTSSNATTTKLGFTNLVNNSATDLVYKDPDFFILDNPPTGMASRSGTMYISAGTNDWYEVTPNFIPNISIPLYNGLDSGKSAYIITKVIKKPGAGLSAALAHEFIATIGDNIIYLAQDHQVRILGSFRNLFTTKYPSISQAVYDELVQEDFTGGHLRCIGDFIFITAPLAGRDYMYEVREMIDADGNITSERLWHPPQIRGISRFAVIEGVTYGHSNQNPQIYQVWDTNQWSDDSPSGDDLPYTSVARFSYKHSKEKGVIDRVSTGRFEKLYVEGYMSNGSIVYGNIYFDYQGAGGIQNVIVNSIQNPATFYSGSQALGIGTNSLGDNPLGDGLVVEANDQELLQKYRVICDINPVDSFEHEFEVYSIDLYSRWEVIAIGTNLVKSPSSAVEIRKSS